MYGGTCALLALYAVVTAAGETGPTANIGDEPERRETPHMRSAPFTPAPPRSSVGCWFWSEPEFEGAGIQDFLEICEKHTPFGLLTTSIRYPVEITDPDVKDRVARAVQEAARRGIGIAMDLDVRLARAAFLAKHPDDAQEIALLRTVEAAGDGATTLTIECADFGDHYTFRARPYECLGSRLLRAYAYEAGPTGVEPDTLRDVTPDCRFEELDRNHCVVTVPAGAANEGWTVCAVVAFRLFTPDVYSPRLTAFERELMLMYAGIPLAGVCKDEWGFPGRAEPSAYDLWYSSHMAKAYAARCGGRGLLDDLLLMVVGVKGAEATRVAAINAYMEMNRERNAEIERAFYDNAKDVFGEDAYVGTHPTWFPFPGKQEAFKNGLDWWAVRRDIAQTDEVTPFAVRTALAKKRNNAYWLNMYYAPRQEDYEADFWRHVLGGGRMNFHPLYPAKGDELGVSLFRSPALQAEQRARLLDFITQAPVACPVAVVFGHPSYLNWAGTGFGDAGIALTDALWQRGIYADLIPSSEVHDGALRISGDGRLCYGPQKYEAAVLYHPEYERDALAAFFREAGVATNTALYCIGEWTQTFDGSPYDGAAALPSTMESVDTDACVQRIEDLLSARGVARQTVSSLRSVSGFPASMVPDGRGTCRLLDGTVITVSGVDDVRGDRIAATLQIDGVPIEIDSVGIAAVRLEPGQPVVQALACGALRRFHGGGLAIDLDEPMDVALWRDANGDWEGAMVGAGETPDALLRLTRRWQRIPAIVPMP